MLRPELKKCQPLHGVHVAECSSVEIRWRDLLLCGEIQVGRLNVSVGGERQVLVTHVHQCNPMHIR